VWRLSRPALLPVLEDEPQLLREILSIVGRRLRGAHERLRSFAYDAADARLAQALLRAAQGDEEVAITRRELAEAAGTSVETAIRVLRRFEREGLTHGEVGRVRLLDAAALRRIAGELQG
jgi:CRP/FNR family transcriptional regulator